MPRQEACAGYRQYGADGLNGHTSICDLHPTTLCLELVSRNSALDVSSISTTGPNFSHMLNISVVRIWSAVARLLYAFSTTAVTRSTSVSCSVSSCVFRRSDFTCGYFSRRANVLSKRVLLQSKRSKPKASSCRLSPSHSSRDNLILQRTFYMVSFCSTVITEGGQT